MKKQIIIKILHSKNEFIYEILDQKNIETIRSSFKLEISILIRLYDIVFTGICKTLDNKNQIEEIIEFYHGKKHGLYVKKYENMIYQEIKYSDGTITNWKFFHKNGTLSEEREYDINGTGRHGLTRLWDVNGKLYTIKGYYRGLENGIIHRLSNYKGNSNVCNTLSKYKDFKSYLRKKNKNSKTLRMDKDELIQELKKEGLYDEWVNLKLI